MKKSLVLRIVLFVVCSIQYCSAQVNNIKHIDDNQTLSIKNNKISYNKEILKQKLSRSIDYQWSQKSFSKGIRKGVIPSQAVIAILRRKTSQGNSNNTVAMSD